MVKQDAAKKIKSKTGTVLYATVKKNAKCNKAVKVQNPGTKDCTKVIYISNDTAKARNIPEDGFLSETEIKEWQRKLRSEKAKSRK